MATSFVYGLPTEQIAASYNALTASSVSAGGPLANVNDGDPATPIIMSGASPWWIKWDFTGVASYTTIKWLVLLGTNWVSQAGRTFHFEANSTDSFGSPPVSQPLTLPASDGSGYPQNIAFDLSGIVGYNATHDWVRLLFVDSDNEVPQVGEVLFYTQRRTMENLASGLQVGTRYPSIVHRTPAGRQLSYSEGVRQRFLDGSQYYDDTDWAKIEALAAAAKGNVRPFAIQHETDGEPLYVTLESDPVREKLGYNVNKVSMKFLEVVNDRVA